MPKGRQKGLQFQILHIYVLFSDDIMEMKGLKKKKRKRKKKKRRGGGGGGGEKKVEEIVLDQLLVECFTGAGLQRVLYPIFTYLPVS